MEQRKKSEPLTAADLEAFRGNMEGMLENLREVQKELARCFEANNQTMQAMASMTKDMNEMRKDISIAARPTLNRQEAARFAGMGESALVKHSLNGLVRWYKGGGRAYYDKEDLLKFMHDTAMTPENDMKDELTARIREKNMQRIEPKSYLQH